VGCIGLIRAVERYEAGRGTTLSTAACPWIRGAASVYETTFFCADAHCLRTGQQPEASRPRLA